MIRIARMALSDMDAVMAIEQRSHYEPWSRNALLAELEQPHSWLLVARMQTPSKIRIVGYICFWIVADELQVMNLTVHGAHRRHGIGRALMLCALWQGWSKQVQSAVLEVRPSNQAARKLYEGLGFQPVGSRPNYYGGHKEPAILMELKLSAFLDQQSCTTEIDISHCRGSIP